jgi:acetolactate synthase-1/3 small subunit/acetolactate synthase II small subunit
VVNARLKIEYANNEGALLRVLGTVERRGFMIKSVAMNEHAGGGLASIIIEVAPRGSERRLEVLVAFLRRLHEVQTINSFEPMQDQAA